MDSESMWPVYLHDSTRLQPTLFQLRGVMVRREATVQAGAASLEVDVATQLKCLTDSTRCADKVLE